MRVLWCAVMRASPLATSALLLCSSIGGLLFPVETSMAQVARIVSDTFPRLSISRREVFVDVQGLVLYLPGSAVSPVVVTTPTVVFSHSGSGGNIVARQLSELHLDAATLALLRAMPLPAGGYNLPVLNTTRPVEFLDVVVLAVDPGGLTFRHREGLARVPFNELSGELQERYSFKNQSNQTVKLERLTTSRPDTEVFLDVRITGSDDPVNPTVVRFTHRDSGGRTIARSLSDLQLTPANRAILLANLNPLPPPMPAVPNPVTFFQTLTVSRTEFRGVEIVRADPNGLIFTHREGGGKSIRRSFDELELTDEILRRFGHKGAAEIGFRPSNLTSVRRESFTNVTITGVDVATMPAANRLVTFKHSESGGETFTRRFGELDTATQAAITNYLTAFPLPTAPTTLPGSGVLIPPGFPGGPPVFVEIFLPLVTSLRNEVFEDIAVVRSDVNGLTFTHRLSGGVPITRRFEDLPDDVRERYDFKQIGGQNLRTPTMRLPSLTTVLGRVFDDVVILGAEPNGLTFQHRGGTTKLPFTELPDEIRLKYDFKENAGVAFTSSSLISNRGEEFSDVVILSSDPVGLTFRHRDGTTKLAFADLPEDIRQKFHYNLDDALDFTRAHSVVTRPRPSRPRFFLITNGYVPAIGSGRFTPSAGFEGRVPAMGGRPLGVVPGMGFAGRLPAIGGGSRVPAVGFSGRVPAIGSGGAPPAIGAGN